MAGLKELLGLGDIKQIVGGGSPYANNLSASDHLNAAVAEGQRREAAKALAVQQAGLGSIAPVAPAVVPTNDLGFLDAGIDPAVLAAAKAAQAERFRIAQASK